MAGTNYFGKAFAREDLAVSTSVVTLSAAVYSPADGTEARAAVITVEAQPIRYTREGTAPDNAASPKVGSIHAADNNVPIVLWGTESFAKFKTLRSGGTDSTIHVEYFR